MESDSLPALERYRQSRRLTYDDLGVLIGVSGVTARRLALGVRQADAIEAQKIIDACDGAVTFEDLHRARLAFLKSKSPPTSPSDSAEHEEAQS